VIFRLDCVLVLFKKFLFYQIQVLKSFFLFVRFSLASNIFKMEKKYFNFFFARSHRFFVEKIRRTNDQFGVALIYIAK